MSQGIFQLVLRVFGTLLPCLLVSACASQLRPPTASLQLNIRSVNFVTGSAQQIRFDAKGSVLNPNELAIKPVGFTYQTFIEGELVDSGDVITPLAFQFKSRTPFVVPLRIPTNIIGGYVHANKNDGVRYKIDLQLTDERFKRTSLVQEGALGLAHLLHLPQVTAKLTNHQGQLLAVAEVFNPNSFILVIDSCSINFTDHGVKTELFATSAFAPKNSKEFSIPMPFSARQGDTTAATYVCQVDGSLVQTQADVTVE